VPSTGPLALAIDHEPPVLSRREDGRTIIDLVGPIRPRRCRADALRRRRVPHCSPPDPLTANPTCVSCHRATSTTASHPVTAPPDGRRPPRRGEGKRLTIDLGFAWTTSGACDRAVELAIVGCARALPASSRTWWPASADRWFLFVVSLSKAGCRSPEDTPWCSNWPASAEGHPSPVRRRRGGRRKAPARSRHPRVARRTFLEAAVVVETTPRTASVCRLCGPACRLSSRTRRSCPMAGGRAFSWTGLHRKGTRNRCHRHARRRLDRRRRCRRRARTRAPAGEARSGGSRGCSSRGPGLPGRARGLQSRRHPPGSHRSRDSPRRPGTYELTDRSMLFSALANLRHPVGERAPTRLTSAPASTPSASPSSAVSGESSPAARRRPRPAAGPVTLTLGDASSSASPAA